MLSVSQAKSCAVSFPRFSGRLIDVGQAGRAARERVGLDGGVADHLDAVTTGAPQRADPEPAFCRLRAHAAS